MSVSSDDTGSSSDLDDVPLYFPSSRAAPSPNPSPLGLGSSSGGGLRLNLQPAATHVDDTNSRPLASARATPPQLTLKPLVLQDRAATSTGSGEPLPSSRGFQQRESLSAASPAPQHFAAGDVQYMSADSVASDAGHTKDRMLQHSLSEYRHQGNESTPPAPPLSRSVSRSTSMPQTRKANDVEISSAAKAKPPRLFLADPATASPVPSPLEPQSTSQLRIAPSADRLPVSLLSMAFAVDRAPVLTPAAAAHGDSAGGLYNTIVQQCSSSLGVAAHDMRLFALQEVSGNAMSLAGVQHVGVMVNHSEFSLAALEDMLAQNRQLQATQQTNAQTIATMHSDYKAATSEASRLSSKCTEQEKELEYLRAKVRQLEADKETLRDCLQRSDEQRQQLATTISTLRKEFGVLMSSNAVKALASSSMQGQ